MLNSLFEDDEDRCHVVAVSFDDLTLLDYSVDDLVGILLHLQLIVAVANVVSLHSTLLTISQMFMASSMPSVVKKMN